VAVEGAAAHGHRGEQLRLVAGLEVAEAVELLEEAQHLGHLEVGQLLLHLAEQRLHLVVDGGQELGLQRIDADQAGIHFQLVQAHLLLAVGHISVALRVLWYLGARHLGGGLCFCVVRF